MIDNKKFTSNEVLGIVIALIELIPTVLAITMSILDSGMELYELEDLIALMLAVSFYTMFANVVWFIIKKNSIYSFSSNLNSMIKGYNCIKNLAVVYGIIMAIDFLVITMLELSSIGSSLDSYEVSIFVVMYTIYAVYCVPGMLFISEYRARKRFVKEYMMNEIMRLKRELES